MLYGSRRYPIRSTTVGTRCLTNDVYSERPSPYFFFILVFYCKKEACQEWKVIYCQKTVHFWRRQLRATEKNVFLTLNTLNVTYPSTGYYNRLFNIQNRVAAMVLTNDYSLSVLHPVLHRLQVCQHRLHLHPHLSAQVCRVVLLQAYRAQVCQF